MTINDILSRIIRDKRDEIAELKQRRPLESFRDSMPSISRGSFHAAISQPDGVNIIAEIKKASPSRGILIEDFHPGELASLYARGCAAALSVLTDKKYFQGHPDYIKQAAEASRLPVLYKDFIIDRYQLHFARYMGAEAVLLIVRAHTPESLAQFILDSESIGLDALVEVHSESELAVALEAGAKIIGVNNRDLADFSVDLKISERLADMIPSNILKVSESGIFTVNDIQRLRSVGYIAFLIGEALVRAKDPVKLLQELRKA